MGITNETSEQRFKRLGALRTNEVLRRLKVLGNCSNRQLYSYTKEDVDKIFTAIERKVKEIKTKFDRPTEQEFEL